MPSQAPTSLLALPPPPPVDAFGAASFTHTDLWVDESHRALVRNLASGAVRGAFEAGIDDCCLTGIALSIPLLLAYATDPAAATAATRALLQYTHKSEDMARQVGWFGDIIAALLEQVRSGAPDANAICDVLVGACRSLSDDKVDLWEVLGRGLSDDDAFYGDRSVFSVR